MRQPFTAPPPAPTDKQSEAATDLYSLIATFAERGWIIGLCVVFCLLGAAYYAKCATRLYAATATVEVEQDSQHLVKIEQVGREDLRTIDILNTIAQKLGSQPLLERVLDTNGLARDSRFAGASGQPSATREELIERLAGMVKVGLRRNTRLIDIKVANPDPVLAARIANSVVEQYMSQEVESRSSWTRGAFAYLQAESERLKKKLEASEQALQAYREEVGSVSMVRGDDVVLPQLRELNLRMAQAKGESIRITTASEQVEHSGTNISEMLTSPQIAGDSAVIEARSILAKVESEFALIRERYLAKHPKYIQSAKQLEEARRGLANSALKAAETLRVACENARSSENGMERTIRSAEDAALKLSQKAIHYNLLERDVESDRALFDNVLNRLKETSLATDMHSEKIRLIAPATPSTVPASPRLAVVFGAALLAGLLLGGGIAFAWGALDTSFKTVEDVEQYLRLPVLTTVFRLREVKKSGRPLLKDKDAYSPATESFRTLRTSLAMIGRGGECRTFLFTSALPKEGKTFSSLNFAASLAQQGLRTLLIDADLRRPSIAGHLASVPGQELAGVTEYLLGSKNLPELVRPKEGLEHFFWIAAGSPPADLADLLAQGKFKDLIAAALKEFDRVVVDSAPINVVSDTLLIAHDVPATVLVVCGKKTPRKAVLRCVHLLHHAGARVEGVVLNMLPRRRSRGYNYYPEYYHRRHATQVVNHQPKKAVACPVR